MPSPLSPSHLDWSEIRVGTSLSFALFFVKPKSRFIHELIGFLQRWAQSALLVSGLAIRTCRLAAFHAPQGAVWCPTEIPSVCVSGKGAGGVGLSMGPALYAGARTAGQEGYDDRNAGNVGEGGFLASRGGSGARIPRRHFWGGPHSPSPHFSPPPF